MTINEKIIAALAPAKLPIFPDIRQKYPDKYYVFNTGEIMTDFADDAPEHIQVMIQVHLFLPCDFDSVQIRKETKKYLYKQGFTYPAVTDASDSEGQHWVFECEDIEEAI